MHICPGLVSSLWPSRDPAPDFFQQYTKKQQGEDGEPDAEEIVLEAVPQGKTGDADKHPDEFFDGLAFGEFFTEGRFVHPGFFEPFFVLVF